MKILVTGATGFLGQKTVQTLLAAGHAVVALGRNPAILSQLEALGAQALKADLRDSSPDQLSPAKTCQLIIHTAALSSPWGPYSAFHQTNVTGLQNLLDWANSNNIRRIIHISTTSLYFDFQDRFNISENDPLAKTPASHYTRSKGIAEQTITQNQGLKWIILRPRGIFGPGDTSIIPRALRVARKGYFPMVAGGRALIDLTYVENVAHAIKLAVQAHTPAWNQIYNISNGEPIAVREFFDLLMNGLNLHPKPINIPLRFALALGRANQLSCSLPGITREPALTRYTAGLLGVSQTLDISKARKRLNYHPIIPLRDSIQATIDSLQQP